MALSVVVLAAGEGKRMRSDRPKVLHRLGGKALLRHVLDAARRLEPAEIAVVIGHGGERVRAEIGDEAGLIWVLQERRLGTGHAVMQALPTLKQGNDVLVLYGDVPLIRSATLHRLIDEGRDKAVALLSFSPPDPFGYGRVVRGTGGEVTSIIEQRDLDVEHHKISECNSGITLMRGTEVRTLLAGIDNDNSQGEYYLTDAIASAVSAGLGVVAVPAEDPHEVLGVNDQRQLADAEREYRVRCADALLAAGVKLIDPLRVDVRGDVAAGRDCEVDVNVVLEGRVVLGDRVRIGAGCVLRDCRLGDDVTLHPYTLMESSEVANGCELGPYARLRPGVRLHERAKLGNFVEAKNSEIGAGSKVNHLSYVGDTDMGERVNVGAGTITCNYDGAFKHRTIIEDGVFIGSDTQLIAPVRIGRGATLGAGSTISKDVPADGLTLSRAPQKTIDGWRRPSKKDKAD